MKVSCGGGHRGKIGCRHKRVWVRSRKSVVVVRGSKDEFMVGMRVRRVMWLRGGKNANALSLRIKPLSLEHEGRNFCWCVRSNGIIGGNVRTIFDSLAVEGGGES